MTTKDPEEQRKITFNGLTAKEWASLSNNVWRGLSSVRNEIYLKHGATFPQKLVERIIKMYSHEGDLVFDPFLGTGITLLACRKLKRRGIGIELNPKFYDIAKKQLSQKTITDYSNKAKQQIKIINDDCRNMLKYVKPNSVQLIITSPPYANFIQKSLEDRKITHKNSKIVIENKSVIKQYSNDERDFGNYNYNLFLKELKPVLEKCYKVTKNKGYNIWVVKDYRDTKNGIPYVDFHSDLAHLGQDVGFKYHDLIIWDQGEQRKLVLLGYPSVFYTNQNCSFLVVFRKLE
ncbi:MAG: DNA methyltransferase [Promethearchaeota archaeon]